MVDQLAVSPLQLKQLVFTKIYVEPSACETEEEEDALWAPSFDFEGVNLGTEIMMGEDSRQKNEPRDFNMILTLKINNETGKKAPYKVELQAQAWFVLAAYEPEKRKSLVHVNGGSMIIGAMREMITQLTGRSIYGPMVLPSLRLLPPESKN